MKERPKRMVRRRDLLGVVLASAGKRQSEGRDDCAKNKRALHQLFLG